MSIFTHSTDSFEGQWPDEKVHLLIRQHWMILALELLSFFIIALIPLTISDLIEDAVMRMGLSELIWFVVTAYYIIWWFGLFYRLMLYLLDTWIVTDHRIVDSNQKAFFDRKVAETKLSRIQDIAASTRGILQTFFDYGNVEIQTAGTEAKILLRNVANPEQIRETILKLENDFSKRHPRGIEPQL